MSQWGQWKRRNGFVEDQLLIELELKDEGELREVV